MLERILKNPFFRDALSLNLLGLSFIFNLICWTLLLWFLEPKAEPITLHYNVSTGTDLTGPWSKAFIVPFLGILVLLINTILANLFYKKNRLLSWLFSSTSFLAQVIIIITTILLIIENAS